MLYLVEIEVVGDLIINVGFYYGIKVEVVYDEVSVDVREVLLWGEVDCEERDNYGIGMVDE